MDAIALKACIKNLEMAAQFLTDAEFSCFEKSGMVPVSESVRELRRFTNDVLRHLKDLSESEVTNAE